MFPQLFDFSTMDSQKLFYMAEGCCYLWQTVGKPLFLDHVPLAPRFDALVERLVGFDFLAADVDAFTAVIVLGAAAFLDVVDFAFVFLDWVWVIPLCTADFGLESAFNLSWAIWLGFLEGIIMLQYDKVILAKSRTNIIKHIPGI